MPVIAGGFLILGGLLTFLYNFIHGRREVVRLRREGRYELARQAVADFIAVAFSAGARSLRVDSVKSAQRLDEAKYLRSEVLQGRGPIPEIGLQKLKDLTEDAEKAKQTLFKANEKQHELVAALARVDMLAPYAVRLASTKLMNVTVKMTDPMTTDDEVEALSVRQTDLYQELVDEVRLMLGADVDDEASNKKGLRWGNPFKGR